MAAMEDVLDLYAEPYDPDRPVVCFDETSTQLLAEVRAPLPPQPGRPQRQDYEYRRGSTRNIFLTCEPPGGLAPPGHHPAAHHAGLRPPDAVASGRGLPRRDCDPRGAGQSEHSPHGVPVRDIPASSKRGAL